MKSRVEHQCRQCRTFDSFEIQSGVRIAYASVGDGPLILCPAWWVSHVERDWQHPDFAAFSRGWRRAFGSCATTAGHRLKRSRRSAANASVTKCSCSQARRALARAVLDIA